MTDDPIIPRFTPAQRRALEWLPADGTWIYNIGPTSPSADSLRECHPDLVQGEWTTVAPHVRMYHRVRLTTAGVAMREAVMKEGRGC